MPKTDKIVMSKADLLKEHKKLVSLLRYGTRAQLLKEATSQQIEAKRYKK